MGPLRSDAGTENKDEKARLSLGCPLAVGVLLVVLTILLTRGHLSDQIPSDPTELLGKLRSVRTYEGSIDTTVDFSNGLRVHLTSDVRYKYPDKFWASPELKCYVDSEEIADAEMNFLLVASQETVHICDRRKNEYMIVAAPTFDLLQREPRVEPLTYLCMAVLKPFQMMVTRKESQFKNRIHNVATPTEDANGNLVIAWNEKLKSPDKWMKNTRSPEPKPQTINMPITVTIDQDGMFMESTAELSDFFESLTREESFVHAIPYVDKVLGDVESQTIYTTRSIDEPISDKEFEWSPPESDTKEVGKLRPATLDILGAVGKAVLQITKRSFSSSTEFIDIDTSHGQPTSVLEKGREAVDEHLDD